MALTVILYMELRVDIKNGWGTRDRTWDDRIKTGCLTAWLYPNKIGNDVKQGLEWCPHTDSNRGPDDYKSTALPTEL